MPVAAWQPWIVFSMFSRRPDLADPGVAPAASYSDPAVVLDSFKFRKSASSAASSPHHRRPW
jgi:hypothetical protein